MKILVLTTSYPAFSGDASGNFIHSLLKSLKARGHELRVIVPGRAGCTGWRQVDGIDVLHLRYALTDRGHMLTSVPGGIPEAMRRSKLAMLNLPAMVGCFSAAAAKYAKWADVIYANWLGAAVAGGIAKMFRNKPMVVTLRGDDAYLIHDRPLWRRAGRWVFRRCAAITAVSQKMVPLMQPVVPTEKLPIIVPTFGVDTNLFYPNVQKSDGSSTNGIFIGNISRAKGVDVLLNALSKCEGQWRFTFVGAGPDLDETKSLAASLKIENRIDFIGQKSINEIPQFMRQADFLALSSRSEGRPNVVMEALASGLAVVATDVGSTAELVADGRGLLVKPDDVEGLAEALNRIITNPSLRRELGNNAANYIRSNNITWDRTAEEFEEIFRKAVAGIQ